VVKTRHSSCRITAVAILGLSILIQGKSIAGDTTLLSIGPRYGFSGKAPLLGKQQTYNFELYDVAATFRLPWSWPLGESPWRVETRLITSAGALHAAGETGFMGTVVPDVALSGWNGFVSLDAGLGLGFFSRDKYGTQDIGGLFKLWGPLHCKSIRSLTHLWDSDFTTSPTQVCMVLMPWEWTCTSSKLVTGFECLARAQIA